MKIKSLIRAGLSALVIVLAGMVMVGAGRARAASYVVSNLNDSGLGSLRQAVLDANASVGVPDTITFSVTGTITLTSGQLLITDDLTITGPGAGSLTISGNNASRVFLVITDTVNISGLTITGGNPFGNGGGIYNRGALTVTNSTISGNTATFSSGGGIYNAGTLTVTNSTISGNTAMDGGGIYNDWLGTLTVTSSTISGNTASFGGGGICNWGALTVTNSTISGNRADFAGGIFNWGALNMSGTLLTGNTATRTTFYGGGALLSEASSITVSGNCFVGNTSAAGFDVESYGVGRTITATGNWWGSASGPGLTNPQDSAGGSPSSPGTVNFVPFLTSQPACGAGQGGGSGAETCTDGRLNCRFGDDYAILYNAQDDHGHPSLHAYCVDAAGNGELSMVVTPHDLEDIPATPAANTQVKSADSPACRTPVSFWVLTTGEYQVNIGPDYKGDLIRMIFDGLPPQGIYFKKCNVLISPSLCGLEGRRALRPSMPSPRQRACLR